MTLTTRTSPKSRTSVSASRRSKAKEPIPHARGGYVEKIAVRMTSRYFPREVFFGCFTFVLTICGRSRFGAGAPDSLGSFLGFSAMRPSCRVSTNSQRGKSKRRVPNALSGFRAARRAHSRVYLLEAASRERAKKPCSCSLEVGERRNGTRPPLPAFVVTALRRRCRAGLERSGVARSSQRSCESAHARMGSAIHRCSVHEQHRRRGRGVSPARISFRRRTGRGGCGRAEETEIVEGSAPTTRSSAGSRFRSTGSGVLVRRVALGRTVREGSDLPVSASGPSSTGAVSRRRNCGQRRARAR